MAVTRFGAPGVAKIGLTIYSGRKLLPTRTVSSREGAIDAARGFGYPVVLKSGAPGHKTEKGAVAIDLRSTDDLVAAWERIFRSAAPDLLRYVGLAKLPR